MAEEHKLQLHLLLNVTNVAALTRQIELEEVTVFAFSHISTSIALGAHVWHVQLDFFLALLRLEVLLLEVDFLMQDLVSEANNAPPEDITGDFVELLGEFVEDGRAALSEEVAAVVIHKLHLLLSFQGPQVHLVRPLVLSLISTALMTR